MTTLTAPTIALDDLARARLGWPEAVLIDLIADTYAAAGLAAERMDAARRHVRFLHELIDGDAREAAATRLDLIGSCAARGIGLAAIEAADAAAFREMLAITGTRFRNSPRLQLQALEHLRGALGRLPRRDAEPVTPPPRSALLLLRKPAFSTKRTLVAA